MSEYICENCGYQGLPLGADDCPECGSTMLPVDDLGDFDDEDIDGDFSDDGVVDDEENLDDEDEF